MALKIIKNYRTDCIVCGCKKSRDCWKDQFGGIHEDCFVCTKMPSIRKIVLDTMVNDFISEVIEENLIREDIEARIREQFGLDKYNSLWLASDLVKELWDEAQQTANEYNADAADWGREIAEARMGAY